MLPGSALSLWGLQTPSLGCVTASALAPWAVQGSVGDRGEERDPPAPPAWVSPHTPSVPVSMGHELSAGHWFARERRAPGALFGNPWSGLRCPPRQDAGQPLPPLCFVSCESASSPLCRRCHESQAWSGKSFTAMFDILFLLNTLKEKRLQRLLALEEGSGREVSMAFSHSTHRLYTRVHVALKWACPGLVSLPCLEYVLVLVGTISQPLGFLKFFSFLVFLIP